MHHFPPFFGRLKRFRRAKSDAKMRKGPKLMRRCRTRDRCGADNGRARPSRGVPGTRARVKTGIAFPALKPIGVVDHNAKGAAKEPPKGGEAANAGTTGAGRSAC